MPIVKQPTYRVAGNVYALTIALFEPESSRLFTMLHSVQRNRMHEASTASVVPKDK